MILNPALLAVILLVFLAQQSLGQTQQDETVNRPPDEDEGPGQGQKDTKNNNNKGNKKQQHSSQQGHTDFGYDGSNGPENWSTSYGSCAGKYQSPIDIDVHTVQTVSLPGLKYHGFDTRPLASTLTNNGHTVLLELQTKEPLTISGGPLRGKYQFTQLHWHWGTNDSVGSEDTINHQSFPMELHMVFYRSIYGSFKGALKYHDGLAVLAFFYEVIGQGDAGTNNAYAEMVEHLPSVVLPNSAATLARQLPMNALLPKHRSQYFTYNGSLTTPPCSEVVTWIDFKQPIRLSHDQVEEFRRLQSSSGEALTHNNRPTQPLGDRVVYFNDEDENGDDDSHAPSFRPYCLVLLTTLTTIVSLS